MSQIEFSRLLYSSLYKKSEYTYQDMVYINACYVLKHAETLNEIFRWPLWIKEVRGNKRERERERPRVREGGIFTRGNWTFAAVYYSITFQF